MDLNQKIVLLTGAGSGIGRCLANELAQQGAQLILADLNQTSLEETVALYAIEKQVLGFIIGNFLEEGTTERVVEEALQLSPRIDVLYNNAGMMVLGQVQNLLWDDIQRLQKVNLEAPIQLSHLLLPHMIKNGGGHIAFTCSASALTTPPGAAAYGMTKAGIAAFAEAMQAEVARHQITVSTICPGFVHTPLAHNADYRDEKCAEQTTGVPRFVGSTPEKVARISVQAIIKDKGLVKIGFDEKVKYFFKTHSQWCFRKINLLMAALLLDKKT